MAELRAVVIGSGSAGEGYVTALHRSGIEIAALCGRTMETAHAIAARHHVAKVRSDWRSAVSDLRPDIVVVATPAAPHAEMVAYASERGCHVLCEKPLGRTGDEAAAMLAAVESAGVRHAYGATTRYAPALEVARDLVSAELIGAVGEVEVVDHFAMSPLLPYCWIHSLEHGGGMLFNVYTHVLAQAQFVTGASAQWAIGRTDRVLDRVPIGPTLHDFRTWAPIDLTATTEWRPNEADLAATVLTRLVLPGGEAINAVFHASALTRARHPGHLAVYGTRGTLHLSPQPWFDQLSHLDEHGFEHSIPIDLPAEQSQAGWNRLVAEFVADIRGEGNTGYPNFRDGYLANLLIDQIRSATHPDPRS